MPAMQMTLLGVAAASGFAFGAGTNNLAKTQGFDTTATWSVGSLTVTANQVAAPDGATTADKIDDGTASALHRIFHSNLAHTNAAVYTTSLYAKAGTGQWLQLSLGSGLHAANGYANFDLVNGVVGSTSGLTASIASVGGGWYRIVITYTAATASAVAPLIVTVLSADTASRQPTVTGANRTFYLWGAQEEPGSTASAYNNANP